VGIGLVGSVVGVFGSVTAKVNYFTDFISTTFNFDIFG
jgi:hypothetical protein